MAENETIDIGAALIKKLSEKPHTLEHLFNIIDRLDTIDQISAIPQALKESATDAMVQRFADNITTGLSIMDSFSGEEQLSMIKTAAEKSESLKHSLEKIAELEKSGTLQSLKEMGDVVAGFSKGMTDEIIERMAGTAEKLAGLTELTLNYNLKPLLDTGEAFINSGTLSDLVELSNGVAAARRMMTDGLIDRAVGTGLDLVEALLTQINIKELLNVIDCSMHRTLTETADAKYHKNSILSLIGLAKDPDVMSGLKFMMLLAKNLTLNLRESEQEIFIGSTFRKRKCS